MQLSPPSLQTLSPLPLKINLPYILELLQLLSNYMIHLSEWYIKIIISHKIIQEFQLQND